MSALALQASEHVWRGLDEQPDQSLASVKVRNGSPVVPSLDPIFTNVAARPERDAANARQHGPYRVGRRPEGDWDAQTCRHAAEEGDDAT
jgi:hypothetical protein